MVQDTYELKTDVVLETDAVQVAYGYLGLVGSRSLRDTVEVWGVGGEEEEGDEGQEVQVVQDTDELKTDVVLETDAVQVSYLDHGLGLRQREQGRVQVVGGAEKDGEGTEGREGQDVKEAS